MKIVVRWACALIIPVGDDHLKNLRTASSPPPKYLHLHHGCDCLSSSPTSPKQSKAVDHNSLSLSSRQAPRKLTSWLIVSGILGAAQPQVPSTEPNSGQTTFPSTHNFASTVRRPPGSSTIPDPAANYLRCLESPRRSLEQFILGNSDRSLRHFDT